VDIVNALLFKTVTY